MPVVSSLFMSAVQLLSQPEVNISEAGDRPPTLPALAEPPLFSSPWWLDAVAPGAWGDVTVQHTGRLRARMAYTRTRYPLVGTTLGIPPLTPYLGPELYDLKRTGTRQLAEQYELMNELIERLPAHDRFLQNFHPGVMNWLPFYWRGFKQHTRYTYQLPDLVDLDAVWNRFSARARTAIRKAERSVTIDNDANPHEVYQLLQLTYANQGRSAGYPPRVLERAAEAARARDQGRLWIARDAAGRAHAGMFLVWNRDVAYYLASGSDPALRASGAMCLLMWHAIRFAAGVSRSFDFEGSMQPGIELFLRGFGPEQVPYFQVCRETTKAAMAVSLKRLFRRLQRASFQHLSPAR
jgi:Acetyltransferase (GNAT) domain